MNIGEMSSSLNLAIANVANTALNNSSNNLNSSNILSNNPSTLSAKEFESPTIADFLPDPIWFEGTLFEFNRIQLIRVIAVLAILLFFGIAAKNAKVRPSKFQIMAEFIITFVKEGIVDSNMYPHVAPKYYKYATTLFCTILFFNITGIIPGLNLAASAGIGVPLLFALSCMYQYWKAGIGEHSLLGFLKEELFPPGIPIFALIIYVPIECAQLLLIRPFSLTIRLFANMMSGHMLLALALTATQYFVFDAAGMMKTFSLLTFGASLFLVCFEIFVAVLQAYIFTLLSCAYINMSYEENESHSRYSVNDKGIVVRGAKRHHSNMTPATA